MKFLRLASLYFDELDPSHEALTLILDGVAVSPLRFGKSPPTEKRRLIVAAVLPLKDLPAIGADGLLDVPEADRTACERAIEAYANTVAVAARTSRAILSPVPSVAFIPETDVEKAHLQGALGIRGAGGMGGIPDMRCTIPITPEILKGLADRLDGVALLSEIYSQTNALGRYRECVRFVELAFAGTFDAVAGKVIRFLTGSVAGHTANEIRDWFLPRGGAIHGDKKKAAKLVLESDVRHFMRRMEVAARDILLNKCKWHDRSSERRPLWEPSASTTSPDGLEMMIVQGCTPSTQVQLLDQFSAYPLDLSASMTGTPAGWWCGTNTANRDPNQRPPEGGLSVRVVPPPTK